MKKIFNIKLDLKRSSSILVGAVQYDKNTNILSILLTDGGRNVEIPNDCNVELIFRRPDRKILKIKGEIIQGEKGQLLQFVLSSSSLSVFGIADIEIRITNGFDILTTGRFALEIRESLLSGQVIDNEESGHSTPEGLSLEDIIKALNFEPILEEDILKIIMGGL